MQNDKHAYQSDSADDLVTKVFRGGLSMADAVNQLRTRLLDLSSRNRLLNYRHPKGRSLQFVDKPSLPLLFDRLTDGRTATITYVREPLPAEYEGGRKPDARQQALLDGLDTSVELGRDSAAPNAHQRLKPLQALLYPADLEKLLRRVASEARTVVEETGTNMLYLMFGFLEFYDADSSDRPMLAPLLALPTTLARGEIDPASRTYKYTLAHSGEDIAENVSLREKLAQDFRLQLPALEEDDSPDTYFEKIERAIRNKARWRVRRQLTLGFLSFGKLAIWSDLDPKKWPGLLERTLLQRIFGTTKQNAEAGFHAEDYDIDRHPAATPQLIYDADSSQHSALIDVLAGKDVVINGPPGTGKSQTITNIVASALVAGKKVLFVSEKLAALEVVRHRLEQAGLGHFCLELHSHKTQKKRFMEDLQARIDARFGAYPDLTQDLRALRDMRSKLNRYAELLNSSVGHEMGQTTHEVFWSAERRRQDLGSLAGLLQNVRVPGAAEWSYEKYETTRDCVGLLAQHFEDIDGATKTHAWSGFEPHLLDAGEETAAIECLLAARAHSEQTVASFAAYVDVAGTEKHMPPSLQNLRKVHGALATIGSPPPNLLGSLLPLMFPPDDVQGVQSSRLLLQLGQDLKLLHSSLAAARRVLLETSKLDGRTVNVLRKSAEARLTLEALRLRPGSLERAAVDVRTASLALSEAARGRATGTGNVGEEVLAALRKLLARLPHQVNRHATIDEIRNASSATLAASQGLAQSLTIVEGIARARGLPFDGSASAIQRLANPALLAELLPGARITAAEHEVARTHSSGPLGALSVAELTAMAAEIQVLKRDMERALAVLAGAAAPVGVDVLSSTAGVTEFIDLLQVMATAPFDLLSYRAATFADPRFGEVAIAAEEAVALERAMRATLEAQFHLDAVPPLPEIRRAILGFRAHTGPLKVLVLHRIPGNAARILRKK